MTISGKIVYNSMGTGFWGIEDDQGQQWLPVKMPEQLKIPGAYVRISAVASDAASIFMWGTPIEILSFHTLPKI